MTASPDLVDTIRRARRVIRKILDATAQLPDDRRRSAALINPLGQNPGARRDHRPRVALIEAEVVEELGQDVADRRPRHRERLPVPVRVTTRLAAPGRITQMMLIVTMRPVPPGPQRRIIRHDQQTNHHITHYTASQAEGNQNDCGII